MWQRLSISLLALSLSLALLAPVPAELRAQTRGVRPDLTGGFTIARLKYTGGGDWYSDETSIRNLLRTLRARGDVRVAQEKEAGVTAIDHLASTHYHLDHIGGIAELAKRIPIRHYVDHGPSVEAREQVANFQATYAALHGADMIRTHEPRPLRDALTIWSHIRGQA